MKRALCIHDLSCVGRASLSVIAPVLSALGVQCCGLPSAVLSTHFGGFEPVAVQEMSDFLGRALAAYRAQGIAFDCVYTGYLTGPAEVDCVCDALDLAPPPLVVVDPVMADGGRFYHGFDETMAAALRTLCARAQVITPNPTEAALLLGQDPAQSLTEASLAVECAALGRLFCCDVLLTGAPLAEGRIVCGGYEAQSERFFLLPCTYVDEKYPGTGDLFAAVLTGALLRGKPLEAAAAAALLFTERATHATFAAGTVPRFGVEFEPLLCTLEDLLCH